MADWSIPITAGFDWSDQAWIAELCNAIRERRSCRNSSALVTLPADPAVGDDVQSWSFWDAIQGYVIGLLDPDGVNPYAGWVKSGTGGSSVSYTNGIDFATTNGIGNDGTNIFTRKYPREIATLASGTYVDGSAFAAGHKARNRANGFTYTRNAGNTGWENPDLSDPDTVTAYGEMQAGDYIGHWIFEEMRLALVAMVSYMDDNAPDTYGWSGSTGNTNHPTLADATAAAETAYNASSLNVISGSAVGSFTFADTSFDASVQMVSYYRWFNDNGPYNFESALSVYMYVGLAASTAGRENTFDTQGYSVSDDSWVSLGSGSQATADLIVELAASRPTPVWPSSGEFNGKVQALKGWNPIADPVGSNQFLRIRTYAFTQHA